MTLIDAIAIYLAMKDHARNVGEDQIYRQAWRVIWQHTQDSLKTADRKQGETK